MARLSTYRTTNDNYGNLHRVAREAEKEDTTGHHHTTALYNSDASPSHMPAALLQRVRS